MDLSKALDDLEIKSLLVRERFYRDSGQWQKLRDSYHPDASRTTIDISWYQGDVDGFVSGSEAMAKSGSVASHTITPIEVTVNGSKALSQATGSITLRFEQGDAMYDLISWVRFVSQLERTAHGWRLLTLQALYERDSIVPVLPGSFQNVPFDLKSTRRSYQCLTWLLSQKGYDINEQLPGLDRPESVNKFMSDQWQWLNAA